VVLEARMMEKEWVNGFEEFQLTNSFLPLGLFSVSFNDAFDIETVQCL
jgi:hypothetical protein